MVSTLVLIGLSAVCNSVMDNIMSYDTFGNYFKRKGYTNLQIWFEKESWENKYDIIDWLNTTMKIPKKLASLFGLQILTMISDAWHFFKVLMLCFLCASIVTYEPGQILPILSIKYNWFIFWVWYSVVFTFSFTFFKNTIK